jgi:hypothetical protein
MIIKRNSAKCTACGIEICSRHGHDFVVHYCKVEPTPGNKWVGEGKDAKLVPSGELTWRFAVDGGRNYLRRMGEPSFYEDTSIYDET